MNNQVSTFLCVTSSSHCAMLSNAAAGRGACGELPMQINVSSEQSKLNAPLGLVVP